MSTIQIYDGEKFVPFNISNAIEMPVGFEDYVSYTELDPGQLIRNGQLVSREIYSDLWNFVQSKPSMLLTEEEWQANLTANEGLACNYYSAGDGSTNFRLPKASVIVLPDLNPEILINIQQIHKEILQVLLEKYLRQTRHSPLVLF